MINLSFHEHHFSTCIWSIYLSQFTNKAKPRVTKTPIKTGGELTCSGKVMNEEMTGKCLRQVAHTRGHLWHRYFITFNQVMVTTVTLSKWWLQHDRAPEFTPGFQWASSYLIFSFMCMFCRSLYVLSYFFFWPLCCLSFFDLRILITP
jgi:hypothetical protein